MMDVVIVCESGFGNTRKIAASVADGVREASSDATVAVLEVAEATPERIDRAGLLIVGGPTHYRGMSKESSRRRAVGTAEEAGDRRLGLESEHGSAGSGIREWLAALPAAPPGRGAAAFDTRLAFPLAGGAARPIGRALRHLGYSMVAAPEGFIVDGARGPLRAGETDRAKVWGAGLVRRALPRTPA
jgi:hypothetical protein